MQAIERAIKSFGSQVAMASALGVKQPTISEWLREERRVPAERCPDIERGTRERHALNSEKPIVTCEELRPDVAWDVLRMQTAPSEERRTKADRRDPAKQGA